MKSTYDLVKWFQLRTSMTATLAKTALLPFLDEAELSFPALHVPTVSCKGVCISQTLKD